MQHNPSNQIVSHPAPNFKFGVFLYPFLGKENDTMAQINTRKRNGKWEYRFEIAGMDGKRKQKSKGGYRTKAEALKAGTTGSELV